jgi:hypothetical protein
MSCAGDGDVGNSTNTNTNLGAFDGPFSVLARVCPSGDTFGPGADGFATWFDIGANGGGGNFDWQFFFNIAPDNHELHYLNYTSGAVTLDVVVGVLSAIGISTVCITHDPAGAGETKLYLAPPGGALTLIGTFVDAYTAPGGLGNLTLFNFFGVGTEPLHGELVGIIQWADVLTIEELAVQMNSIKPCVRLDAIVNGNGRFYPMLNEGRVTVDESGNDFDTTLAGTLPTSTLMPAVPWGSSPYL